MKTTWLRRSILLFLLLGSANLAHVIAAQSPNAQGSATATSESSFGLLDIVSLVMGVIGIVGTIYTIRSWRRSEDDRRIVKYLFDTAERNLQKDITEADIRKKKEEANRIASEIHDLQKQLRESIPHEARRAVLKDKLFSQELLVTQTYAAIQSLREELGPDAPPSNIPLELRTVIEKEISPEYVQREERSHLKNQLTVMTTAAAIFSSVLPDPFGNLVSVPLFLLAAPIVLKLYRSYLPKDAIGRRVYTYRIVAIGSLLGIAGTALYPVSLFMRGVPIYRMNLQLAISSVVALGFFVGGTAFWFMARRLSRKTGRDRPNVQTA